MGQIQQSLNQLLYQTNIAGGIAKTATKEATELKNLGKNYESSQKALNRIERNLGDTPEELQEYLQEQERSYKITKAYTEKLQKSIDLDDLDPRKYPVRGETEAAAEGIKETKKALQEAITERERQKAFRELVLQGTPEGNAIKFKEVLNK